MQLGGNWTTDGALMTTSLFSDMRSAGNWYSSSIEDLSNTTGRQQETLLKGRLSTVDLLVLNSLDKLLIILKKLFTFKTSYPHEEVSCT